jgi:bifunctional UDP-N-acetylglucosamine pyrophosphorylase/glucosamine-1-phosphate N-acetyltransferase
MAGWAAVSTASASDAGSIDRHGSPGSLVSAEPRGFSRPRFYTDWYSAAAAPELAGNPHLDAIILAAGKGTRLRPHTENTPKPLLPVQGRPILDWIIGALPPVERLVVVVNYLADQIDSYLAAQTHVRNWTTVRQAEPRGTGDALMSCKGAVTGAKMMVLNGDDLLGRADLARLAQVPMGILTHPVGAPESYGIVFRAADGTLSRIAEKPKGLPAPQLANVGGYVFPREVFDLTLPLSPRNEYEITDAVGQLAAKGPFHVVAAEYWLPIGTVEQWQAAQTADVSKAR